MHTKCGVLSTNSTFLRYTVLFLFLSRERTERNMESAEKYKGSILIYRNYIHVIKTNKENEKHTKILNKKDVCNARFHFSHIQSGSLDDHKKI